MAAFTVHEPGFEPDPDTIKVPESPEHRRVVELIGVIAERLLGRDYDVFRDMNWYPTDGGRAIAPDVMVLPANTLPKGARSYRQDQLDGPLPSVVVEVPSETNSFFDLQKKLARYRRLDVVAYLVSSEDQANCVLRQDPNGGSLAQWDNQPIPELGGLRLSSIDDRIMAGNGGIPLVGSAEEWIENLHQVISSHEQVISSHEQIISSHEQIISSHEQTISSHEQTISSQEQVISSHEQVMSEKDKQINELADRLRSLGVNPDQL